MMTKTRFSIYLPFQVTVDELNAMAERNGLSQSELFGALVWAVRERFPSVEDEKRFLEAGIAQSEQIRAKRKQLRQSLNSLSAAQVEALLAGKNDGR